VRSAESAVSAARAKGGLQRLVLTASLCRAARGGFASTGRWFACVQAGCAWLGLRPLRLGKVNG